MAARLGEVLFWACIILAGLWLYAVYGPGGGPKVDITGYAIGAGLVLIGSSATVLKAMSKAGGIKGFIGLPSLLNAAMIGPVPRFENVQFRTHEIVPATAKTAKRGVV
jgi:hypothetical protein